MKIISSVRDLVALLLPNAKPRIGVRLRTGRPALLLVSASLMIPAKAIVSPSCTVTCVFTVLVAKLGDEIFDVVVGWGALTFWLITIVTTPLAFTNGVMLSETPVLRLPTVLVKSELPDDWAPAAIPCEVRVGTSSPTFREAAMLSVAMMLGA